MHSSNVESTPSRLDQLAAFLRARPNQWIDARILARVGGYLSFRTRLSELRRAPYFLDIRNRTRSIKAADGSRLTASEYLLMAADTGEVAHG